MKWELNQLLAVAIFAAVVASALGLLRPEDRTAATAQRMRILAIGLFVLFLIELGIRLGDGTEPWTAFVCSANPKASLRAEQC